MSRTTLQFESHPYVVKFDWVGGWAGMEAGLPKPDPELRTFLSPGIEKMFEAYDGPNPTGGSNSWTNFTHYKRVTGDFSGAAYRLPKIQGVWPNSREACWVGLFPAYAGWFSHQGTSPLLTATIPLYGTTGFGVLYVIGPSSLDSIKQRALNAMMPGIKTEMSLVNSVIELRDFKGLVRSARNHWDRFRSLTAHLPVRFWGRQYLGDLYSGWKTYLKYLKQAPRGEVAQSLVGAAASNFLQWKFAIKPLIDDVRAVRRALKSLEKKINRLITNEGRVRTSHWTTSQTLLNGAIAHHGYSNPVPFDWGTVEIPTQNWLDINVGPTEALIHVELRYNYNLTQYQREHARLLSLLDSVGLNFNPAIIWNAVRYTFLLDWIVNVSSYLDQFKVANMEPKINVLGALWSSKAERVSTWSKGHYALGMPVTSAMSLPSVSETAYQRRLWKPGSSSLITSGLNSSEFTLGAALVFARSRRKASKK